MKLKYTILIIIIISLLSGCNPDEPKDTGIVPGGKITVDSKEPEEKETEPKSDESKTPIVAEPLPATLNELAELSPGYTELLYAINDDDEKKIIELTKDLPDISEDVSNEELDNYYNQLLSIFQRDFKGPEDIIKTMKFQSIGDPDIEDPRRQFKENLNVMVILDASGSMGKKIGSQTQMDAAKTAIQKFVTGLPKETNVGLRVYGQKGTGDKADKSLSCSSSELLYPISPFDSDSFSESLSQAKPAGWTPIQLALNEAQKDLAEFSGKDNTNIVYLVSDGISTCDDDPITAAKMLYDSDITPIVNVIGFNVDREGQKQLREIAKATEGSYQDVTSEESLQNELDQAKQLAEKWEEWKEKSTKQVGYKEVENSNDIFVYMTHEESKYIYEKQQVGNALFYLFKHQGKMSEESHEYLLNKHNDYHQWIRDEYDKLKAELKSLNEMNSKEAIKALEEKYQQNTSN
ncbi:MAG: VWA domain-containing protein [Paenisporosarcina sp.]